MPARSTPQLPRPEYLQSPLLLRAGFRHAFFTRNGGVSSGPYTSLNFSWAVGDAPENVARNLELAGEALGVDADRVCFLSQVHGARAVLTEADAKRTDLLELEGDALVATHGQLACGVRTADCVPILLADPASGAVAAVHAGWRGVVRGVVRAAVECMAVERAGSASGTPATSSPSKERAFALLAAIGPHISVDAFEVSDDVAEQLCAAAPDGAAVVREPGRKPHVDLRRLVRAQLVDIGLSHDSIDDVPGCTLGEPQRFFSYRRDGKIGGRHLSAIVPRGR